jgi:hypothetical protein
MRHNSEGQRGGKETKRMRAGHSHATMSNGFANQVEASRRDCSIRKKSMKKELQMFHEIVHEFNVPN